MSVARRNKLKYLNINICIDKKKRPSTHSAPHGKESRARMPRSGLRAARAAEPREEAQAAHQREARPCRRGQRRSGAAAAVGRTAEARFSQGSAILEPDAAEVVEAEAGVHAGDGPD